VSLSNSEINHHLRLGVNIAIALIVFLGICDRAGSRASDSCSNCPTGELAVLNIVGTSPHARLPACPPAGSPMLRLLAPHTGHHSVILSWNANPPTPKIEDDVVGYCLYRSKKRGAAKKNPTCKDCEQINFAPMAGTRCVDNLVQDRITYYYVVTAINSLARLSASSDEATAVIPSEKESVRSISTGSPLCREPDTSNAAREIGNLPDR
jgi:hypothetical protein